MPRRAPLVLTLITGLVLAVLPAVLAPAASAALPPGYAFRGLQLNLCNSGLAGCYQGGRSVPEARDVILAQRPDVVTVNEVCRSDIATVLAPALAQSWPGDPTFWTFSPAWNAAQNGPYQCTGGRGDYGNAVLGHVRAADWQGVTTSGGRYRNQAAGNNELRSWACAHAVGNYYACTTHLAASSGTTALAQCRELLNEIVPAQWAAGGRRPTAIGGDFNLRYGGSPNVQTCVPTGWYRKGDGSVQHWFMTADLRFVSTRSIGLRYTDHPAWIINTVV
ncbi:MAG TPA: endonuclease/exonuclease/phosphatase family protein [Pseudonocardiaceae bacterium]